MTLQFTLIYRTSNFAESKALDFETRNVFKKHKLSTSFVKNNLFNNTQVERNKMQKRYYSNTQKKDTKPEEKVEQAQTWYEYYISPYFTPEYYYVGQIATTVAVVTTAAVVYWYVAPMVVNYLYGNTTNNDNSTTATSSTAQKVTNYTAVEIPDSINDTSSILKETLIHSTKKGRLKLETIEAIKKCATSNDESGNINTMVNSVLQMLKLRSTRFKEHMLQHKERLTININEGKYNKAIQDHLVQQKKVTAKIKNEIINCFNQQETTMSKQRPCPHPDTLLEDIITLQREYGIQINKEILKPIIESLEILKENEILSVELEVILEFIKIYYYFNT